MPEPKAISNNLFENQLRQSIKQKVRTLEVEADLLIQHLANNKKDEPLLNKLSEQLDNLIRRTI